MSSIPLPILNRSVVIFIKGLVFGVTLAIALGPIALLIIDNAARGGLRAGLGSAFGAASGDLTYAVVTLVAGTALLPVLRSHAESIQAGADLVLIAVGLSMIRSARRADGPSGSATNTSPRPGAGAFRTTYLLTVVNPLTIIAFMAFVPQLSDGTGGMALMAVLGLFTGSLVVQVGLALGGTTLHRLMSPPSVRALNILSGCGVVAFGCVDLLR